MFAPTMDFKQADIIYITCTSYNGHFSLGTIYLRFMVTNQRENNSVIVKSHQGVQPNKLILCAHQLAKVGAKTFGM